MLYYIKYVGLAQLFIIKPLGLIIKMLINLVRKKTIYTLGSMYMVFLFYKE
jgi:hypothetical protein